MYIGRFNTKFLSIYRNYSLHSWYFLIKLKKIQTLPLQINLYVKNTLNYISWRSYNNNAYDSCSLSIYNVVYPFSKKMFEGEVFIIPDLFRSNTNFK